MGGYNPDMSIRDNLSAFRDELQSAAQAYGRKASEITIMAVSKTRTIEEIIEAREAGLELFGENRVEEASEKFSQLDPEVYPLTLIGHLQGKKAARIDSRYSAVHSVDSVKIAEKLSSVRRRLGTPLEILLQVNTSGEETKSGFRDFADFIDSAAMISELPYLSLRGLMTMAPFVNDEKEVRSCFSKCRDWSEKLQPLITGPPLISMGMSSDFRWAVAEGSNLLRIGTTLFGARD